MLEMIGLVAGLGLLIWLALRDVNIIFAAVLCALVIIVTNGLPFAKSLMQTFTIGVCTGKTARRRTGVTVRHVNKTGTVHRNRRIGIDDGVSGYGQPS